MPRKPGDLSAHGHREEALLSLHDARFALATLRDHYQVIAEALAQIHATTKTAARAWQLGVAAADQVHEAIEAAIGHAATANMIDVAGQDVATVATGAATPLPAPAPRRRTRGVVTA